MENILNCKMNRQFFMTKKSQSFLPVDIIAISFKDVLENLGAITGEEAGEEIINEIFSRFCLGK